MQAELILMFAALQAGAATPEQAIYKLKATPKTVAWGYYAANTPAALRIRSGDSVEIETLITNSPARLEAAGVPPAEIEPALRDIYREVTDKGPGGHILTGPIYVEGAEPGDTLEVRIRSIQLAIPYAYNTFRPGAGFLPDEFPFARTKIVPLDRERMIARFSTDIEIPLRPFFGSMGGVRTNGQARCERCTPAPWKGSLHWSLAHASVQPVGEIGKIALAAWLPPGGCHGEVSERVQRPREAHGTAARSGDDERDARDG
jgi:acetamidase/formamidase